MVKRTRKHRGGQSDANRKRQEEMLADTKNRITLLEAKTALTGQERWELESSKNEVKRLEDAKAAIADIEKKKADMLSAAEDARKEALQKAFASRGTENYNNEEEEQPTYAGRRRRSRRRRPTKRRSKVC